MSTAILLILGVLGICGMFVAADDNIKKRENIQTNINTLLSEIKQDDDREYSDIYVTKKGLNAVALSQKEKIVSIYIAKSFKIKDLPFDYDKYIINFEDILEAEVIIDNETVTKTARGSQVGGAIVGGALFGGVGAMVGGLSGKSKSTEEVKNIDIKLTINDINNPIYKVNFLHNIDTESITKDYLPNGYKKDSQEYTSALEAVEKWQGMFEVILNNKSMQ